VSGFEATVFTNDVTVTADAEVFPISPAMLGQLGQALVWGLITPEQSPSYTELAPTQSPSYTEISPSSDVNWVNKAA
jgi:hypothetical protein